MALIRRNTTYSLNDIVYTTFGVKLKCTTAGTTSTGPLVLDGTSPITDGTVVWEIQEENHVSIGTIISYMGNAVPERFLACDGTAYNITDYPDLADHINTQFGSYNYFGGDGATTFAVPDLRGEFLRGSGTNSHTNQGSGANVGVHQNSTTMQGEAIYLGNLYYKTSAEGNNSIDNADSRYVSNSKAYQFNSNTNFAETTDYLKYSVRPTNTSVLYCIKYI